jgi:hypothetical protein
MTTEPPRILLVEDNPDDAEMISIGLKRHNLANGLASPATVPKRSTC